MKEVVKHIDEFLDSELEHLKDRIWYELSKLPLEEIEEKVANLKISYGFAEPPKKPSWDRIGLWRREENKDVLIRHIRASSTKIT